MIIKAVIFDLFGVIFRDRWKEFLADHKVNLTEFLYKDEVPYVNSLNFSKQYPAYYYDLIKYNTDENLKENKIDDEDFYFVLSNASKLEAKEIKSMIHDTSVINQDIISTIKHLRQNNFIIGLLTNGDRKITNELLEANDIKNLFDHILTSEEAGVLKPNVLIYKMMIAKLNFKPQEMIYIDDSLTNTEAAQKLGFFAISYVNQNLEKIMSQINEIHI